MPCRAPRAKGASENLPQQAGVEICQISFISTKRKANRNSGWAPSLRWNHQSNHRCSSGNNREMMHPDGLQPEHWPTAYADRILQAYSRTPATLSMDCNWLARSRTLPLARHRIRAPRKSREAPPHSGANSSSRSGTCGPQGSLRARLHQLSILSPVELKTHQNGVGAVRFGNWLPASGAPPRLGVARPAWLAFLSQYRKQRCLSFRPGFLQG